MKDIVVLRVLPFVITLHLAVFGLSQVNSFQPLALQSQLRTRTKTVHVQTTTTVTTTLKKVNVNRLELTLKSTIQDNSGQLDAKEIDNEYEYENLTQPTSSALSMNLDELSHELHGRGKAQLSWDCFRIGIDPIHFHNPAFPEEELDNALRGLLDHIDNRNPLLCTTTRKDIQQHLSSRRESQTMGSKALKALSQYCYPSSLGIESSIATLSEITRSNDGTTKLLLKLVNTDFYIESVIIPNPGWGKSTLCISSQVGCAQGCVFCATGKMGRLASLTPDQILVQLYYANKVCRVINSSNSNSNSSNSNGNGDCDGDGTPGSDKSQNLPQIDNVVFMGMGDAADNIESVKKAVDVMTDRSCFALAPSKITISTVGPSPDVFDKLAQADAVLAWSVHAVRDDLRKKLVPSTKYTMVELRDGVVHALTNRSKRMRALMLEIALMDGLNDGVQEAEELADFCVDLTSRVEGMKLMVNLIPFNDIGYEQYRRPSDANLAAFQKVLVEKGVKTYVRTTRGDDESAACGQLATKKRKKQQKD
jgi:23S rRNA (adenine2503-C2)-methyltransferase